MPPRITSSSAANPPFRNRCAAGDATRIVTTSPSGNSKTVTLVSFTAIATIASTLTTMTGNLPSSRREVSATAMQTTQTRKTVSTPEIINVPNTLSPECRPSAATVSRWNTARGTCASAITPRSSNWWRIWLRVKLKTKGTANSGKARSQAARAVDDRKGSTELARRRRPEAGGRYQQQPVSGADPAEPLRNPTEKTATAITRRTIRAAA